MEKEFYLVAPENHHYELGTLIRQILPFAQILAEAKAGVRGIVLSENETKAEEGKANLLQRVESH